MKDPFSPEPTALQIRIAILVVGISTAVFATSFIFKEKMEQAEAILTTTEYEESCKGTYHKHDGSFHCHMNQETHLGF